MLSYCLKSRKKQKVVRTKNGRILLSKCELCDSKKSRFIKEQEASRLLSSLAIKIPIPLRKIHLLGPLLF